MKEIKNTTVYTEDQVKTFLQVYYFERIKTVRIIINILIVILIIYFFRKYTITPIDIITFCFALFGILELNTNMLPKLNYYKLKKKKNNVLNTKIKYVFKENNFKLTTTKDEYIDYNTLKKIIEIPKAYYLYINSSRALIVSKETLQDDEITILSKHFKEKVSTYKYKNNV